MKGDIKADEYRFCNKIKTFVFFLSRRIVNEYAFGGSRFKFGALVVIDKGCAT